jgi:site-specific DNA recombinase
MNTTEPRKLFLYARKSTDDLSRQVRSIGDQLAELHELARRDNIAIVEEFIERQTAKKPGRPIFNEMLARLERGQADGVLAWHPDRLSRNSVDAGKIIWLIDTGVIKALRFPTYWFEPSAHGKFSLSLMLSQSKYYIDNLSENIRRGQRQKVKNGIWPLVAPVGYLNDRLAKTIYPDPVRAPLIRKAFELYASGTYTIDRLVKVVNELGMLGRNGKPLFRTQYHRILQNPLYCGIIRYSGEEYEGKHQAIVSKELFDNAAEVMARKSKPKTPTLKPYLYRGVFRCGECGCFITTETQKGHNYLRCTKRVKRDCSQPFVREQQMGKQITGLLRDIALPAENADSMIAALEVERDGDTASRRDCLLALQTKAHALDAQLSRLTDAYLAETLSLEEFRDTKAKLIRQRLELKEKIATLEANSGNWFEPAIRFVKAAKSTAFLAETGTEEEKRDFLKKVSSNLTVRDRRLHWEPRGAWKLVVDSGSFAQHNTAPGLPGAVLAGEKYQIHIQRRSWDSNPGDPCGPTGFQDRRIRPLCHSSGSCSKP